MLTRECSAIINQSVCVCACPYDPDLSLLLSLQKTWVSGISFRTPQICRSESSSSVFQLFSCVAVSVIIPTICQQSSTWHWKVVRPTSVNNMYFSHHCWEIRRRKRWTIPWMWNMHKKHFYLHRTNLGSQSWVFQGFTSVIKLFRLLSYSNTSFLC